MEKIKVAFVKFAPKARKTYLFEMPFDSYLEGGDTVIVPNADGEETEAVVVDTERYQKKYNEWNDFIRLLGVAGVELPLKKVLGEVKRIYYSYKEDNNEDDE